MRNNVPKGSRPMEILLVEDNPGDVYLTERAFADSKIDNVINVLTDGEDVLAYLNKDGKYADVPTPDIILLDLNLPKKDGYTVLSEIKADPSHRTIPVVILTSSKDDQDILKSYGHYANSYLTKPVSIKSFNNIVSTFEDFWFSIVVLPPST